MQQIDRPRADRAAAGQRDLGLAHPREQRRDDPETRPHFRDELVGRRGVDDLARGEVNCAARMRGRARPPAIDRMIDAVMAENAQQHADVGEISGYFRGSTSLR